MASIGLDTSNYTTSCAFYDSARSLMLQRKRLLPVPAGQAGLRQSDALFHHTRQLPELFTQLMEDVRACGDFLPEAVGVSVSPRSAEGSYMPCFLSGKGAAEMLAAERNIPLFPTSHQMGHILAALYSAGKLEWVTQGTEPFLAFHVSGGTTDCVRCTPDSGCILRIEPVSESTDLKAGQAIDRTGLLLGLSFPCGAQLEQLAMQSDSTAKMRVKLRDGCCSLSGLQNQCEQMFRKGASPADTARYCLNSVSAVIYAMCADALQKTGCRSVIFAGGVMSDRLIQNQLAALSADTAFSAPEFSCDNAVGTAIYAELMQTMNKTKQVDV